MKKLFGLVAVAFATILGTSNMNAQTYKTGAGLMLDFGNGATFVGPHVKHFFTNNSAGEFSVLFANGATIAQANYQYQQGISGAKGLGWYVGAGPGILFGKGYTQFAPSAMVGLDFKIPGSPLDLSMDWRPRFIIGDNSDAEIGRFTAGFRFTF